MKFRSRVL